MRELQGKAKAAGLWAMFIGPDAGGTGTGFLPYVYLNEVIGRSLLRAARLRLPGARHGQRRDPPRVRHARAEGALAAPARRGRDPLVLRHDRARGQRRRSDLSSGDRGARPRAVGDQRAQVVQLGRRGRGLRDRDGGHRARGAGPPALQPDHRPRGHAGPRDRARDPDARSPRPRLEHPLRGAVHERPGPRREPAGRARPGFRHRPDPAGARAHPPLHALDRPGPARLRDDVRLRAEAARLRRSAERQADGPELDRRERRRDPGRAAHDPARGLDHRPEGGRRGAGRHLADQVLRGESDAGRARPRDPGPWRPRGLRRHAARGDVPRRTRHAARRRTGRGPSHGGEPRRPPRVSGRGSAGRALGVQPEVGARPGCRGDPAAWIASRPDEPGSPRGSPPRPRPV